MMPVEAFLFFDGNCREAMSFYTQAFDLELPRLMTYGDLAADPAMPLTEAGKSRILYASLKMLGSEVMFADVPEGLPLNIGNHISLSLSSKNPAEIRQLFDRLAEGGVVDLPLEKSFFSEQHGMLRDKFGIGWIFTQINEFDGPTD